MTFADLDNVLVLHGPPLTRLMDDEFFDLCQDNPLLRLERTATRELLVMPPAASESSRKPGEVHGQLWLWNREDMLVLSQGS